MKFDKELDQYMRTTLNPVRRKSWSINKFIILENRKDYALYDTNMKKIINLSDPEWIEEISKDDWEKLEGVLYV